MRQSTTLTYLLLLLVAVGAYYFINNREEPADIALTVEPEDIVTYLFNAEDGVPTGIRIESKTGEIVEVARGGDGAWVLKNPIEASADQAAVEAAASQASTMRIEDTLPDIDLAVVGLKSPEYTITAQFKDNVERKVGIGVITPTESGYYVLDPTGNVVIISKFSIDALLVLLTTPPYLETPTPSPTATETSLPTPIEAGTATPATITPQP